MDKKARQEVSESLLWQCRHLLYNVGRRPLFAEETRLYQFAYFSIKFANTISDSTLESPFQVFMLKFL